MVQSPPEGSPQLIPSLYCEDADSALGFLQTAFGFELEYGQAVATSARGRAEPAAHFGGNRQYTVRDPGGYRWTFALPIENP